MALISRRSQATAQDRIRTFVADNAEALEPGLTVLETNLRLGHATIDVVAVDAKQTLVLVAIGEVADTRLLLGTLDAYLWCLAFPDNLTRLYPNIPIAMTRPPRLIFVARQVPEEFLEQVELLSVVRVECQELPGGAPEAHAEAESRGAALGARPTPPSVTVTPAPAPARPAPRAPMAVPEPAALEPVAFEPGEVEHVLTAPSPALDPEPAQISAGYDAGVAQQWERFLAEADLAPAVPVPDARLAQPEPVAATSASPAPSRPIWAAAPKAPGANGHPVDGHIGNGHAVPHGQPAVAEAPNGHGPAANGPTRTYVFAQAVREAGSIEHAAVNPARLTAPPAATQPLASPPPVPQPQPAPAPAPLKPAAPRAQAPAPLAADEPRTVSHPALESLRFPKTGVSRQWQDFLDQLAANQ